MSKRTPVGNESDPERRFDDLFNSHYAAVHRYCFRRLGPADAEDAAADVFAVAWRRLPEMPEGLALRAWLFGVAYRVVGNQYRSRRRQASLITRLVGSVAGHLPLGASEFDSDSERELLLQALQALRSADAEILRLSAWESLSRSEISIVLGIKENAVDQRLHRARRRLGERLADLGANPSHLRTKEESA